MSRFCISIAITYRQEDDKILYSNRSTNRLIPALRLPFIVSDNVVCLAVNIIFI